MLKDVKGTIVVSPHLSFPNLYPIPSPKVIVSPSYRAALNNLTLPYYYSTPGRVLSLPAYILQAGRAEYSSFT